MLSEPQIQAIGNDENLLHLQQASGSSSLAERLLPLLLCLFVLSVPLLYWGTTDAHRARVLLLSLPLLLAGFWARAPHVRFDRWFGSGLVMASLGLALGASQAQHQVAAWLRVSELAWCLAIAVVAARAVRRDPRTCFLLLLAVTAAFSISNFRLVLEWLSFADPRARDWAFAIPGYFHYRNLGFAAAPALVVLSWTPYSQPVGQMGAVPRCWMRLGAVICSILGWAALAWSGSRAGVICSLVGVATLVWLGRGSLPVIRYLGSFLACAIIGSIASVPFIPHEGSFGIIRIINRVTEGKSAEEFTSGRLSIYADGWERFSQNWGTGLGPDQYQAQASLPSRILEPHNALLEIGLEAGVLGLLGGLLIVVGLIRVLKRKLRKGASGEAQESAFVVVALLCAFTLYSMVDGVLFWLLPQTYLALLIGSLVGLAERSESSQEFPRMRLFALRVPGTVLLGLVGALYMLVHLQSEALARTEIPLPEDSIAKSVYAFPGATWGALRWVRAWEEAGDKPAAERWYRRLIEESPAPYFYRIEYGYFLVRERRSAEALREIERGLADAPDASAARLERQNEPLLTQLRRALADG